MALGGTRGQKTPHKPHATNLLLATGWKEMAGKTTTDMDASGEPRDVGNKRNQLRSLWKSRFWCVMWLTAQGRTNMIN